MEFHKSDKSTWKEFIDFSDEKLVNLYDFSRQLEKIIKEKKVGSSRRRKMNRLVNRINKYWS